MKRVALSGLGLLAMLGSAAAVPSAIESAGIASASGGRLGLNSLVQMRDDDDDDDDRYRRRYRERDGYGMRERYRDRYYRDRDRDRRGYRRYRDYDDD